MAYAILYVDNASVIGTFDGPSEGVEALNAFVAEHPEVRDEVALLELDSQGRGVGDYVFADTHSPLFA
ncbi:MAG TPA: hypothetical protein VGF91_21135 [Solirubrobacteraceae bacterium]|jgi:hypothetical protein